MNKINLDNHKQYSLKISTRFHKTLKEPITEVKLLAANGKYVHVEKFTKEAMNNFEDHKAILEFMLDRYNE
jgi:uncharacterized alpha/beta hydrolase family protein